MSGVVDRPIWPPGGGEMAQFIHMCNWAATSLGPMESWSARLRLMVEQVLASPLVSSLVCGSDCVLIYNDAAARLYGNRHPAALGRPLPQTFPEGWATVAPFYTRAFAGESVQVISQPLDTHGEGNPAADVFDAVLLPVREEDGRVTYVHMAGIEVSEQIRAEAAVRETEKRQSEDLAATRLLQQFSTTLIPAQAPEAIYEDLMDVMMALMRSQTASIQTFDERSGTLKLIAYRGYAAESAAYWETVDASSGTVCGLALKANSRMVIPDVETYAPLAGTRHLEEYRRCGLRGLQSTPLLARDGRPLGMISTCWHEPHEPGEEELRRFDVLARQTADLLERARAAATLRESEERLRTALSMQTVGVLFWDEDFKLTDVNDAFLRMTRCTQDEALGKSWQELTPSEFHSASENAIAELKARGEITPYEKQYFRCDSSRFWGLFAMRILGRGAVEFVLDVTDRKNAEAALHASEERLRQFGEASQDVLWIRDVKTLQWTYLTPAFETIYGLSREEALSGDNYRSWLDLLVSEDRKRVTEAIDRVRAGEHVAFEYRIRRPVDGAICWLRNTDFPMRGPSGAVEWIGGVGQDVTELKRIEAALRDEEARQRALIEGIPQLVWRAGEGGLWTWSSPQWRAYTGQSDKQSYGWGWLDALHPDDQEAAHDAWRKVKPDGMLQMECRIRQAVSGQYNWFQIRGRPVRDDGRIIEWIGSCTDIDDQMQARAVLKRTGEELEARVAERTAELMAAEASLRQAQKMEAVGQLTAGIAHDFNNMLQGIAGSLELMRRRSEQGRLAEAMRHVENAHETVCRAAALTHRLLAFSCQQTLAPVPVNLDELVVGMTEMIRRTMGPAIRVEARLDGSWPVLCDVSQLENALLNLCVNARDAMPNGGWLTILTGEEQLSAADLAGEADLAAGAYGTISVTDTGTGMPPEVVARVFEPFYTTKPFGQGTGLGLSQVYGFVHQSGGFVRIESTPGQGTTVRLFLPCHTTMDETQDSETAAADVVLLVEDEPGLREMAAEWLRDAGYRVLEVSDGAAALRLLHGGGRVDILVTDVGLPGGMNGRQVANAARAERPDLPVLFITGYAGTALRTTLPKDMAVIDKPFALDELVTRIRTILESRHSNN